ncbi:MAG TPA: hypothetical protein IGS52_23470 [Oscillatoriaceae cyanobacterium M33_DOE_052]|uniref:Glucose-6-phosphate dehydrogenase NAD-binding domain-containing protein n=1 Tax=Planktothricoides sp. SpSt-374 TaxID=2282167 RepID=A0A7C3ZKH6_9CYAN|nr:hypothetical protein [Oscillatoriaceae cyanobacterium M33_DOE_052]
MAKTLILHGSSGDLSQRQILPALLILHKTGQLNSMKIIALAMEPWDTDTFASKMWEAMLAKNSVPKGYTESDWLDFVQEKVLYMNLNLEVSDEKQVA